MSKKVVFLMGGYGNNLFQINKAYDLRSKGYSVVLNNFLIKDNYLSRLLNWSQHSTEMLDETISDFDIESSVSFFQIFSFCYLFILKKLKFIDIQCFSFESSFSTQVGYWQSGVKLNDCFMNHMRTIFMYEIENIRESSRGKTIVHARLGDFSPDIRLDVSYYCSAILALENKDVILVTDTESFLIQLDDELLKIDPTYRVTLSNTTSVKEDFILLMSSSSLVLSNSTFCFWASQIFPVESIVVPTERRPNIDWYFPLKNKTVKFIRGFK